MTRARRVHQGERTQSEVRIDPNRRAGVIEEGQLGPGSTAKLGERVGYPREGLEVPEGRVAELTVHDDGTSEAHLLPEGTALSSEPAALTGKLCKACANKAPTGGLRAVTSPSGTQHLQATSQLTLCGREIGKDWTR